MLVVYDPATLAVRHVVRMHPPGYHKTLEARGETYVRAQEALSHHEIEIVRDGGEVVLRKRMPMPVRAAASSVRVGDEVRIEGVPVGALVEINRRPNGEMDASGVIEFAPQTAGAYRFRFSGSGWVTCEVAIEAVR